MSGSDGQKAYLCMIIYEGQEGTMTLHGTLTAINGNLPFATNSPIEFSQGK